MRKKEGTAACQEQTRLLACTERAGACRICIFVRILVCPSVYPHVPSTSSSYRYERLVRQLEDVPCEQVQPSSAELSLQSYVVLRAVCTCSHSDVENTTHCFCPGLVSSTSLVQRLPMANLQRGTSWMLAIVCARVALRRRRTGPAPHSFRRWRWRVERGDAIVGARVEALSVVCRLSSGVCRRL